MCGQDMRTHDNALRDQIDNHSGTPDRLNYGFKFEAPNGFTFWKYVHVKS